MEGLNDCLMQVVWPGDGGTSAVAMRVEDTVAPARAVLQLLKAAGGPVALTDIKAPYPPSAPLHDPCCWKHRSTVFGGSSKHRTDEHTLSSPHAVSTRC